MTSFAGIVLIAVGFIDIAQVVLLTQGGVGLLTGRMLVAIPGFCVWLSERLERPALLALSGPMLIIATVASWFGLAWLGLSLICWPMLDREVVAPVGPTPTSFATAIYHAGFNLTTLGTGDLIPNSDHARLITVFAAAVGFALLTLSLSYLTSVYSAVRDRCRFASSLNAKAGGSGDPRELVGFWVSAGTGEVSKTVDELSGYIESHRFYPVLHGFLFSDAKYDMSQIMRLLLISTSSCKIVLANAEANQWSPRSRHLARAIAALHELAHSSARSMAEFVCRPAKESDGLSADLREVFEAIAADLSNEFCEESTAKGIAEVNQTQIGRFLKERASWERHVSCLSMMDRGAFEWKR